MSEPLVTVVIPTYNRAALVVQAIESVLAQTYRNFEVIVVNDGSKDDTAEVLKRYGLPVRVINKPNGGNVSARNRGIEESRGELVAFLDDDDRWLPNKLEVQVPQFDDPEIHLVHTGARFFDDESGWDKTQFIGDIGFHDILGMQVIYGQTVVMRKSVLDKVGHFDEKFSSSVEDLELWLRISVSHRIKGIDVCTAEVRCHEAAVHSNLRRMYDNNMLVVAKYEHVHGNCAACAEAVKKARKYLKVYAYEECKSRARRALKRKAYFQAISLRANAFYYDPAAFALMPFRAIRRLVGRGA